MSTGPDAAVGSAPAVAPRSSVGRGAAATSTTSAQLTIFAQRTREVQEKKEKERIEREAQQQARMDTFQVDSNSSSSIGIASDGGTVTPYAYQPRPMSPQRSDASSSSATDLSPLGSSSSGPAQC